MSCLIVCLTLYYMCKTTNFIELSSVWFIPMTWLTEFNCSSCLKVHAVSVSHLVYLALCGHPILLIVTLFMRVLWQWPYNLISHSIMSWKPLMTPILDLLYIVILPCQIHIILKICIQRVLISIWKGKNILKETII